MGNSEGTTRSFITNQQELNFYMDVEDHNLGTVPIYTSRKMPLCYIMKMQCSIVDSKIYNLFQRIQNSQVPSLVSMYGYQMNRHKYCDKIVSESVTSYWQYYNFYFFDYLKKRSGKGCPFMESEVWHIVDICCQAAAIMKKYNSYFDFQPKKMVITPQGKLKVCWWHLMSQNKHLNYFKFFEDQQFEPWYYSPEELQLIRNRQLSSKINFDKCNSFGLGMVLLYCISLTDPLFSCYTDNFTRVNFKSINHILESKVYKVYSQHVGNLLNSLLARDPKDRASLAKVHTTYRNFMSQENQLRVCGGKKQERPDKDHQQIMKPKSSDFSDAKTVKFQHTSRKD